MLTRLTRPAAALTLAAGLAAALPATAQDFDFSAMTPE